MSLPALTATVPAAPPPPGVVSDFVDPPYIGTSFVIINTVFMILAILAVTVRIYTRVVIVRGFGVDDCVVIFALVTIIIVSCLSYALIPWGLGRHMWDVPLEWFSPHFNSINLAAAAVCCAPAAAARIAILLFYLRVFPNQGFRIACWAVICLISGYCFASAVVNVFGCNPVAASWDVSITDATCINRPVFYLANAGLGISSDFLTLIIPLPLVYRLQMPFRQKLATGALLLTGSFVCVVSLVRLKSLFLLLDSSDLTWNTPSALIWTIIEADTTIVCGSIPAMVPLITKYFPSLLGRSRRMSDEGQNYGYGVARRSPAPRNNSPAQEQLDTLGDVKTSKSFSQNTTIRTMMTGTSGASDE